MVVSIVLGIINVYGLTQTMNQDDISSEYLRFGDRDKLISSEQLSSGINKLRGESDAEFAKRITKLIADGIFTFIGKITSLKSLCNKYQFGKIGFMGNGRIFRHSRV